LTSGGRFTRQGEIEKEGRAIRRYDRTQPVGGSRLRPHGTQAVVAPKHARHVLQVEDIHAVPVALQPARAGSDPERGGHVFGWHGLLYIHTGFSARSSTMPATDEALSPSNPALKQALAWISKFAHAWQAVEPATGSRSIDGFIVWGRCSTRSNKFEDPVQLARQMFGNSGDYFRSLSIPAAGTGPTMPGLRMAR
jgi:hypothetical protein